MAAKPDVVVYGGTTDEGGGPLTTYLAQAGYHGLFVSGDGIAQDPAFAEQVNSPAASGVFAIVSVPDPSQLQSDAAARFVHDFHARYPGEVLDGYGVDAFDAAQALIAAISRLIQQGRAVTRESYSIRFSPFRLMASPASSLSTTTATALIAHSASTPCGMASGSGSSN